MLAVPSPLSNQSWICTTIASSPLVLGQFALLSIECHSGTQKEHAAGKTHPPCKERATKKQKDHHQGNRTNWKENQIERQRLFSPFGSESVQSFSWWEQRVPVVEFHLCQLTIHWATAYSILPQELQRIKMSISWPYPATRHELKLGCPQWPWNRLFPLFPAFNLR